MAQACARNLKAHAAWCAARGVQAIQGALIELRESRYELLTTSFNITLAEGLNAIGRHDDVTALTDVLDRTLGRSLAHGTLHQSPSAADESLAVRQRLSSGITTTVDDTHEGMCPSWSA